MAATIAPVSSNSDIFSVIAARITASCHSSGKRQRARPAAPIAGRFLLEAAGRVVDARGQRFVRAQDEVHRPVDHEERFGQQVAQRRIGVQP